MEPPSNLTFSSRPRNRSNKNRIVNAAGTPAPPTTPAADTTTATVAPTTTTLLHPVEAGLANGLVGWWKLDGNFDDSRCEPMFPHQLRFP